MYTKYSTAGALTALALILGCSSLPERIATLDEARSLVESLENDPLTRDVAADRYAAARQALESAQESYDDNEDLDVIEQQAFVALRNAQIAEQQIAEQRAREELEQGEAERNRILLQAREQEAENAQQLAAQRQNELARTSEELRLQQQATEEARQRAEELERSAQQLEQQLSDLQTEQTERGLVMTLGDVLFDVNGAQLKAGAEPTMMQLAEFLEENPERNLLIEGHTDSTGAATYNQGLSERRAEAVRDSLESLGIDDNRIRIEGLGESYPVATNGTAAGRQLNRRVEIVLSDQDGEFPPSAMRTASAEEQDDSTLTR